MWVWRVIVEDYRVGSGLVGDRKGPQGLIQVCLVIIEDILWGTSLVDESRGLQGAVLVC